MYLEELNLHWYQCSSVGNFFFCYRSKQILTNLLVDISNFSNFQVDGDNCLDLWSSPLTQSIMAVFGTFIEYLLPLIILVYCYGRILWTIRTRIGSQMGSKDAQTAKFEMARDNVVKTLLIVFFFFVICFLGIHVYYVCFGLGLEVDQNSGYYNFTVCLYFLNCTINPFIYLVNYRDFQKALLEQFCCRTSRHANSSDIESSTLSTSVGSQRKVHT